jgi:ABC-2 type transport system ATP-binding protein
VIVGGLPDKRQVMAAAPIIQIQSLRKIYQVPERQSGFGKMLLSLVYRKTRDVVAVDDISFDIHEGEMVGFLGANGAGKTTTLKMLTGILHPSSGEGTVMGYVPWLRKNDYLRRISMVMGQRNQLVWDIPAMDSFELQRVIYRIPQNEYKQTLQEFTDLLELGPLLNKPVRNLSLGERMKCEIAGALLHRPKVLFLDEPTLGLDVTMQRRIRSFIREYNQRHGTTVLLTSHYMADVEALCKRVVVIHRGKLLFDGKLEELVRKFSTDKTIVLHLDDWKRDFSSYGEVLERVEGSVKIRFPKEKAAEITGRLLAEVQVRDLTIEDPPIEDVIEQLFARGVHV